MKFNNIHFIINPASGKEEPILFYINQALDNSGINWEVSITKKDKSSGDIAKGLVGKTDLVVVYGGDGCVTDVASALHGSDTPMAIIPGGTANVMAKELGIPLESVAALKLLTSGEMQLKSVDMGLMNGHPFLLRINLGIMADMVLNADQGLKNNIGQLAYGIAAVKTLSASEPIQYHLEIDGQIVEEKGVSLTVTNSGNIGIGDFALQPGISITDGLLDIILLRDTDFMSLLKVTGSTLLQNETDALKHWQCKKVVIRLDHAQHYLCDDYGETAQELSIEVVPSSIQILVPSEN